LQVENTRKIGYFNFFLARPKTYWYYITRSHGDMAEW
jgi:hypothetical protein